MTALRHLVVVLIVGLSTSGMARMEADSNSVQSGRAGVKGTVSSVLTKRPISQALVVLTTLPTPTNSGHSVRTQTDDLGRFDLSGLPPGAYSVTARAEGFAMPEWSVQLELRADHDLVTALQLIPLGAIRGVVVDEAGEPLTDAPVRVFGTALITDSRRPVSARTNDLGEFGIEGLTAGSYQVVVDSTAETAPGGSYSDRVGVDARVWRTAPDLGLVVPLPRSGSAVPVGLAVRNGTTWRSPPCAYPGVSVLGDAQPVVLAAGAVIEGLVVVCRRVETTAVEGQVASSVSLTGSALRLFSTWQSGEHRVHWAEIARTTIESGNRFRMLAVPPGDYDAVLEGGDGGSSTPLVVSGQPGARVTLAFRPSATLRGEVVDLSDQRPPAGQYRVTLNEVRTAGEGSRARRYSTWTDADGRFALAGVRPGQYAVRVTGAPGTHVVDLRSSVGRGNLLSVESDDVLSITVRGDVWNPVVQIGGRQPELVAAAVIVFPEDPRSWELASLDDQRFRIAPVINRQAELRSLPIGTYIVALVDGDVAAQDWRSHLERFAARGRRAISSQTSVIALMWSDLIGANR